MVKSEIIEKLSVLSTGAFGLVAALAWNSAIQKIFQDIFGEQSSIGVMLGYAVIVTVLAVLITLWIGRISEKAKKASLAAILRRKKVQEAITKEEAKDEAKAKV
jgi:uncharacterized BrkB/YihY/UPF0761 family membrane protein